MFNSIKKDESRRRLVKKFEITRLQNKVLLQAIFIFKDNHSFIKKLQERKTLSQQVSTLNLKNINTILTSSIPIFSDNALSPTYIDDLACYARDAYTLDTNSVLREKCKEDAKHRVQSEARNVLCYASSMQSDACQDTQNLSVPYSIKFTKSNNKRISNEGDILKSKVFYNNNIIADSQFLKSSLYLLAKKKKIDYIEKSNNNVKQYLNIYKKAKKKQSNASSYNDDRSFLQDDALINNFQYRDKKLVSHEKFIPRNSSINRIKNRCIETGRSHSVLSFCKLSRICLRDKASKGIISGVSKASW